MENLFISVIIPCYNVEQYVSACVESIIADKRIDIELILVDDGSSDSTGEICDAYSSKDKRIKVIHQQNGGVSSARNAGLSIASGEWIWFVDSDDTIAMGSFDVLKRIVASTKCDTIFFGLYDLRGTELKISSYNPTSILHCNKNTLLINFFCYCNPTMLFSRSIIEDHHIRFSLGIRMAEDLEFQYKYLIHCNAPICIDNVLYIYNHHEGSAMNNIRSNIHNVEDCLRVCKNLQLYIEEENLSEIQWLSIRIRLLLKSGIQSAAMLSPDEVVNVQDKLRYILNGYERIGYKNIADSTLKLARFNLRLYFFALRVYRLLKAR